MSAVAIARALLVGRAALITLVTTTNIRAGVLPEGTALPAVSVMEVSRIDHAPLKIGAAVHVTSRVQVTVMAKDYPQMEAVMAQVRHACRQKVGLIAGFAGATCHLEGVGPVFCDETNRYVQTQDLRITYTEVVSL